MKSGGWRLTRLWGLKFRKHEAVIMIGAQKSKAMADQIMAADKKRLKNLLGTISRMDMHKIDAAIRLHLALD